MEDLKFMQNRNRNGNKLDHFFESYYNLRQPPFIYSSKISEDGTLCWIVAVPGVTKETAEIQVEKASIRVKCAANIPDGYDIDLNTEFAIPVDIKTHDIDKTTASIRDGLLFVEIPKIDIESVTKKITIN